MARQMVDAALEYTKLGWHVFPIRPGEKIPLTEHGFKNSTTSEDQIRKWWEQWPEASIGIATGPISGLLVLDIDPRHRGDEMLDILTSDYGWWDDTKTVKTGGGGTHYYFECHEAFASAPGLWEGIDVKISGGYVVAPPSSTKSRYSWIGAQEPDANAVPLRPAPEWVLEKLRERRTPAPKEALKEAKLGSGKLASGDRNTGLFRLAGSMRRLNVSYEGILSALVIHNKDNCTPPLLEEEVDSIARGILRYEPAEPTPSTNASRVYILPYENFFAMIDTKPSEPDWILEGWMAKGDCAILAGDPGAGKSFLSLDLGLAGATGLPIWDYFPVRTPFRTLILDEENPPDEVHRRLYGITQARGIKSADIGERMRMTTPRHGFTFRKQECLVALRQEVANFRPDLIVLDSFTATSPVTNEGDSVEIRRFFHETLNQIQAICGSAILYIHHTNKTVYSKDRPQAAGGMIRGSIDFLAAADTAMLLDSQAHSGYTSLSNVKPRRMKAPTALKMKIQDTATGVRPIIFGTIGGGNEPQIYEGRSIEGPTIRETIMQILNQEKLAGEPWTKSLYEKVNVLNPCSRKSFDTAVARMDEGDLLAKDWDIEKQRERVYRPR